MALSAQQKQVSQHTLCNIKRKEKRTRWFSDAEWFFGAEWQVPRTQPPQLSKWLDTQKHRDTQGYFLGHTRVHTTHPAAAAISSARGARICKCCRSDTFLPHPLYTMGIQQQANYKADRQMIHENGKETGNWTDHTTGTHRQNVWGKKKTDVIQTAVHTGHWSLNLPHTSGFIQKS